nr:uncharacterized protein LOC104107432 [Nicotiana tomentosiformis]
MTEEDQDKKNEVDVPCLFNKAQQALNRVTLEAEIKELAEKEHAVLLEHIKIFEVSDDELDTVSNGLNPQVQQKIDRVNQLRAEMDEVKAMAEEWKGEAGLAEAQLRSVKEKVEIRSREIENVQSQLGSAIANRDTLVKELEAAKSEAETTRVDAEDMVAQYKADVEAAQERLKAIVEYVKWQSRREALDEVHARRFDLSAENDNVKRLEAEAKKLAYPEDEEDSECSDRSDNGEDYNGLSDEAGSDEDQAS